MEGYEEKLKMAETWRRQKENWSVQREYFACIIFGTKKWSEFEKEQKELEVKGE